MKKYNLIVTEHQLNILKEALDLYEHIGIGQLEEVANYFRWSCDSRLKDKYAELNISKDMLVIIKKLLFNMLSDESFGIRSKDVPERYKVAYDIKQVIRYQLWKDNSDGRDQYTVDARGPLQSAETQLLPEIKQVETERGIHLRTATGNYIELNDRLIGLQSSM